MVLIRCSLNRKTLLAASILLLSVILVNIQPASATSLAWNFLTVDPTYNVGTSTSIAIDQFNLPHISYLDWQWGNLKYAHKYAGYWFLETVDSGGAYSSLALDWSNKPHISYLGGDSNLKYAWKDWWNVWHIDTVDYGKGRYSSLALEAPPSNLPHISYLDEGNGDLMHAWKDASGIWHTETVDTAGSCGWYSSLALDSSNYPHISYTQYGPGDWYLKYSWKDASGIWHTEAVPDPAGQKGEYTSLALDKFDRPHISYRGNIWTGFPLNYAMKSGTTWIIETVDTSGGGGSTSIAIDSLSNPAIAYKAVNGHLRYAKKSFGGSWYTETVDTTGSDDVSLALDLYNNPHISYWYSTIRNLQYAFVEPVSVQSSTGQGPVSFSTDWGSITSLQAVNPSTVPPHPTGYVLPYGLFSFIVTGLTPGQAVTITIEFPSVPTGFEYWKYQASPGPGWFQMSYAGTGNVITIILQDGVGGPIGGDSDNIPGQITDPSGLAVPPPPPLAATVDIDPDTLDLRSKGQWITAYIQLPEGYNPEDIDASTILLNGTIQPVLDPKYGFVTNSSEYLVDHNNDGVLERMVKFDRAAVASWIYQSVGMEPDVSLAITGKLFDGTPFEGTDTISAFWTGQRSPCKR
jgi:hypothetical protein